MVMDSRKDTREVGERFASANGRSTGKLVLHGPPFLAAFFLSLGGNLSTKLSRKRSSLIDEAQHLMEGNDTTSTSTRTEDSLEMKRLDKKVLPVRPQTLFLDLYRRLVGSSTATMSLATCGSEGPAVRTLVMKRFNDEDGTIEFVSSSNSPKGTARSDFF